MARPTKKTVDYFPHQTKHGKTLYIIEQVWGNDGYSFWFKLLELLGSTDYHFVDFNDLGTWEYFVASTRVGSEAAVLILNKLSLLSAIDDKAWSNKVVYSDNFCANIIDAYARRNDDKPDINRVYEYINSVYGVNILTENQKGKETKTKEKKIPPKQEEVIDYCKSRGKGVDPEKWFDFYTSKGWMVGKNKMKDWKAAVRTWEKNSTPNDDNRPAYKRLT